MSPRQQSEKFNTPEAVTDLVSWGGGDGGEDGDGDVKRKPKELPETGSSQSKRHSQQPIKSAGVVRVSSIYNIS